MSAQGKLRNEGNRRGLRRYPRHKPTVPLRCVVVRRRGQEDVRVDEASYDGMLVVASTSAPANSLLKLRIELPTGHTLVAHAVVTRAIPTEGRYHLGLRFFALSGEPRQRWEEFIAQLARFPNAA